jgi:hypothetical protein
MTKVVMYAVALCSLSLSTSSPARDICNREDLATHMKVCVTESDGQSDYEKGGMKDVLKGRFCGNGALVRDGMFRCQSRNVSAIALMTACPDAAALEVALKVIADQDPRKGSCN